jgi:hypothetical protein
MSKTNVRSYTDEQLLNRVKSLPSFNGIPEGRWIIGVRSNEDAFDTYDDKFYEYEGEKFIRVVTGTTNSGGKQLKGGFKSFNKYGSAILKADQWYYNVWQYGMHRGKMPALRQRGAKVMVYRDGNMNNKAEEIGKPISGWYGINYHTNTYDFSAKSLSILKWTIGNWSAGCQVVNDRDAYFEQMDYYRLALKDGTQKFVTYVLLNEFDPAK